jgi:hypothetical protein
VLYASPEQMSGRGPDPRDDVHAIGVIWYQMVTGDLSRGRPGGSAWKKRLKDVYQVPAAMVDLMESCFNDAEDRPADAGVLAEQLAALTEPVGREGVAQTIPPEGASGGPGDPSSGGPERPASPLAGNPPVPPAVASQDDGYPSDVFPIPDHKNQLWWLTDERDGCKPGDRVRLVSGESRGATVTVQSVERDPLSGQVCRFEGMFPTGRAGDITPDQVIPTRGPCQVVHRSLSLWARNCTFRDFVNAMQPG